MERDVLQVLTEDHAVLVWLADRLSDARPGRARSVMFGEFARALGAHQTVIDLTVLPALKTVHWSGVSSDVLTSHMALKRLLAECLTVERNEAGFDEALRRLATQAKLQCGLEQHKLLPVLRGCLDESQREMMAFDAEMHLTRLLGETPTVHEVGELAPRASDLVEEAYVVLGSLASGSRRRPLTH